MQKKEQKQAEDGTSTVVAGVSGESSSLPCSPVKRQASSDSKFTLFEYFLSHLGTSRFV